MVDNQIKRYLEITYNLLKESRKLGLEKNEDIVLSGGVASNSYFNPENRRFSDDFDVVLKSEETIPKRAKRYSTKLRIPNINDIHPEYDCYSYKLEGGGKIYFIIDPEVNLDRKIEKIGSYAEYFLGENGTLEVKRLSISEIFRRKLSMLIWNERGFESLKDIYDIALLSNDLPYEKINQILSDFDEKENEIIKTWMLASKRNVNKIAQRLKFSIASRTFPKKEYINGLSKIENILKNYKIIPKRI